jgi:hypothetical protein
MADEEEEPAPLCRYCAKSLKPWVESTVVHHFKGHDLRLFVRIFELDFGEAPMCSLCFDQFIEMCYPRYTLKRGPTLSEELGLFQFKATPEQLSLWMKK